MESKIWIIPENSKSKYNSQHWLGQKFNKLTVIALLGVQPVDKCCFYWLTECECGRQHRSRAQHVVDGKVLSCRFCRHQSMRTEGFTIGFLNLYRGRAKEKGLAFEITLADLTQLYLDQNGVCALSGQKLTLKSLEHRSNTMYNVSIDRIDSSKGYTKDNIQLVTKEINLLKNKWPQDRFIELCKLVAQAQK